MKIKINGLVAEIIIGCESYERLRKQSVIVDVECDLYQKSDWFVRDELSTTVNYADLVNFIQDLLPVPKYNLLENLAQYLAVAILNRYCLIEKVKIDLVKPMITNLLGSEIKVSYIKYRQFRVALGLGSSDENLPQQQIITAIEMLAEYLDDIHIGRCYLTKPVGGKVKNNFVNSAIIGSTSLLPDKLLAKIKFIEKLIGKRELQLNGTRIIDIDLLLYDDLVYENNFLRVPHVRMHLRDFVLAPLTDVAANWQHPVLEKSIKELFDLLPDGESNLIAKVDWDRYGI